MNKYHNLHHLLLAVVLLLTSFKAVSHELKATSARITLRDGQVEIRIITNIIAWQKKLQDNQAWLMGDIDHIMPANLNAKNMTNT